MARPEESNASSSSDLEAPPQLVAALQRLGKPAVFVPATADEAVLRAAERRLNPARRRTPWLRFLPWLAAASMAIVLAIAVPSFLFKGADSLAREDLNHDGVVDILDAFALARQVKAGTTDRQRLDLNGDGAIDDRDVAILAAHAVKLERGGHS